MQKAFSQTRATENLNIFKNLTQANAGQGKVTVRQDEQIEQMVLRYIEYRKKDSRIPGYRIRIFSDSGTSAKTRAISEQNRFAVLFPDISAVLIYEQPNFKVYVGDFRTKGEGYKAFVQIKKDFPRAFLVFTKVNPPKL
jgi:hypothetical protein